MASAFHRLKVVDCKGPPLNDAKGQQERLFNFEQLQWWIGRGNDFTELEFASQPPVFVAIGQGQMERLTGGSKGYSSDT